MLCLVVEGEAVYSDLGHLLDIAAGMGDVQVAVEVRVGQMGTQALDDRGSDGEVGDEMAECKKRYPSMTSMWSESAPRSITCWQSLARSAKSAERMEGPTKTLEFLSLIIFM